jgi:lipopolysaccharide transport system permease protein
VTVAGANAAVRSSPRVVPHRWLQVRDLLLELIARDIKLRYRGSALGITWTLLNPLAELLVLLLVFSTVFRSDTPHFPAYLFTGLLAYGWFQTALNFATVAVVGNRELVRRPGVPVLILPVVTVASNLAHFLLSLPILFGLLLIDHVPLTRAVVALPFVIAIEFLLILGFAYPVAIIHVWFRDTQHVLRVLLQLLFYLTPVFYDVRFVPERLQWVYAINPMAHMVDAYRAVLIRGEWPNPWSVLGLLALSITMLAAGMSWFSHANHRFADEL